MVKPVGGSIRRYQPGPVPDDARQLQAFLRDQLEQIAATLSTLADGQLDVTTVAPAKPRDGMIRYADGTSWNPGSGEGFYGYWNGGWIFLGGSGSPGGADTQVQFNDGGAFGGDSVFTWNKTTNLLTVGSGAAPGSIVVNGPASSVPFALTSSASVSVDAAKGNNFRLTLAHTMTIANPTNLVDGQVLNFYLEQDATGSRVVTWGTKYKFAGGSTYGVLSTAANAKDFMSCYYEATDDVLMCVLNKAFA